MSSHKELLAKLEAARAGRAMEGERRVVTMLFCDVKGSTAMAETLDPEEWDTIAQEDDPQRAVWAGLDIVSGIAAYKENLRAEYGLDLDVRVGITPAP